MVIISGGGGGLELISVKGARKGPLLSVDVGLSVTEERMESQERTRDTPRWPLVLREGGQEVL